jgi:hypothetical protein
MDLQADADLNPDPEQRLIKRNLAEWNGAWSDGSGEWNYVPDEEKENLGLNFEVCILFLESSCEVRIVIH